MSNDTLSFSLYIILEKRVSIIKNCFTVDRLKLFAFILIVYFIFS
jgi:hypothetical protein